MTEQELRDAFAAAAYPKALEAAIKPYGHLCDAVTERAAREAYEAADVAMLYRRRLTSKKEALRRFPEPTASKPVDEVK